ncbi:hypothetical protein BUALT_Bualt17G0020000 [Buddleja alternifolia]|uniref:RNA helicase n=1 Tax=Buddleja alternifolia TaxID=168488 RepID=A0AAV6WE03_9LAMI|nr:hypothetical protein BUALT_Bualt17G0020000 [Buddleja alternifolia]
MPITLTVNIDVEAERRGAGRRRGLDLNDTATNKINQPSRSPILAWASLDYQPISPRLGESDESVVDKLQLPDEISLEMEYDRDECITMYEEDISYSFSRKASWKQIKEAPIDVDEMTLSKPPRSLDKRIISTSQVVLVMLLKDHESYMAKTPRKPSALVCGIDKTRERFWELAHSKRGDILGVEKTVEQIDADSFVAGEQGEIDLKEDTKFSQQLKKCLPIFSERDALMKVIRKNQVVIVVGKTGSGKTTKLTQYLHEDGYTSDGLIVSEEMCTELGNEVGYDVRFEDVTGPTTSIKYMTDGVLLRETLKDDDLENYRYGYYNQH